AMRKPRISGTHCFDQRLHYLALDPVRKMTRVGDVLEAAPAIRNLLVLRKRVGDQSERPQIFLEGLGQCFGSRLAFLAVGILQQIERRLDRQRLSADLESQRRDGFVEKAIPGGISGY